MNPLRFELVSLSRSRGAWVALAVACAPAAFSLLVMLGARRWNANPESLARIWWPSAFVFATMAQAALLPILQMYILGDSLAGQVADRRLRSLLLCPVSHAGLYAGKLGAAWLFAASTLLVSLALHALGVVVAMGGTEWFSYMASRGYATSMLLFAALFLASQLALASCEGLVFSLAGSLKTGLLGVAALAAMFVAVQVAASRASESWQWLGHLTFTYHYLHGLGFELLAKASTARLETGAEVGRPLAAFAADVIVFGSLGYWAFRRREV